MYKKLLSTLCAFSLLGVLFVPAAFALDPNDGITQSIREGLRESIQQPSNDNIEVFTDDGTVYLRGKVYDNADIAKAEGVAKSTAGVKKVVNQLELASDGTK